jgi:hypothetical protein
MEVILQNDTESEHYWQKGCNTMAKVNQKWYEQTTKSIGMYEGMNGFLETIIPYEEIDKPVIKEMISPAAFIANPNYKSSFIPETAAGINFSERIPDRQTMRQEIQTESNTVYWTRHRPFLTQRKPYGQGINIQGNNFWPAIQNCYQVNDSRMYYKGYLANVLGFYTAYYQHWQGGMVRDATNTQTSGAVFPQGLTAPANPSLDYLRNYFPGAVGSRYASYGNNKKLVQRLDWKISKKGVIYPAREAGVKMVGMDLPGYEKYGDFTAWSQMMWGRLPSEVSSLSYLLGNSPELGPVDFDNLSDYPDVGEDGEVKLVADFSAFDGKYVVRQNIMSGLDPLDVRLDELIKLLGRNYSVKMYLNAAKMISHSANIYPYLKPEVKSQFEASVLSWLNRWCLGAREWTSEMLQIFDSIAVSLKELIPEYENMLRLGWDNQLIRGLHRGDVAHEAGFYGGATINQPGFGDGGYFTEDSIEAVDGMDWQEIVGRITNGRNAGEAIFELMSVALCRDPSYINSDYPDDDRLLQQRYHGLQAQNFLTNNLNFTLKKGYSRDRYGNFMHSDRIIMNTPAGNLMEGTLNTIKEIREECSLQNYPLKTTVEITDGDSVMVISSQNKFIKSYWDVDYNALTVGTEDGQRVIPDPLICNLIILESPMPIVTMEHNDKSQGIHLGMKSGMQGNVLRTNAKSLMTPYSAYDSEWWDSFLSTENGFLHYFETHDFTEPYLLKRCWDVMELWESEVITASTPSDDNQVLPPFTRPYWAEISYHEAFLKIYQGQEVTMEIADPNNWRGRLLTEAVDKPGNYTSFPEIESLWAGWREFTQARGITDEECVDIIKSEIFPEGLWDSSESRAAAIDEAAQAVNFTTNTALVAMNAYLAENDRYNYGTSISVGNEMFNDMASKFVYVGYTGDAQFWEDVSNYSLMNLRSGNRRVRTTLTNFWDTIGSFGWSAERNKPDEVSEMQDTYFADCTENGETLWDTNSQLRNAHPIQLDVFALPQNWDFPVNRVFAGAKSGYKFIINWTRILNYRLKNLLSN